MDNQPQQYKQGFVEFYKLRFKVNKDVLIPRPETELLVDVVLDFLKTHPKSTILDLGTGAGNIAISISKNSNDIQIVATDISKTALRVAQQNARLNGVSKRIKFIHSNLLKNPIIHNTKYKSLIIVTNLPYIPTQRIPYLDSSVKDYEPHIALDGGEDGFELYRKLFQELKEKGWKPKLILGEIDYTHAEIALNEATNFFPDAQVEVKTDLAHKQRILKITEKVTLLRQL